MYHSYFSYSNYCEFYRDFRQHSGNRIKNDHFPIFFISFKAWTCSKMNLINSKCAVQDKAPCSIQSVWFPPDLYLYTKSSHYPFMLKSGIYFFAKKSLVVVCNDRWDVSNKSCGFRLRCMRGMDLRKFKFNSCKALPSTYTPARARIQVLIITVGISISIYSRAASILLQRFTVTWYHRKSIKD